MAPDTIFDENSDRARIAWWVFILGLTATGAFIAYSFIGLLVVGVFGYYATRPIYRQVEEVIDSDGIAAGVTVALIVVPILLISVYAGFQIVHQIQQVLGGGAIEAVRSYFGLQSLPSGGLQSLTSALNRPQQFLSQPQQTLQTILRVGGRAIGALVGGVLFLGLAVTLSYFLLKTDDTLAEGLQDLFGGRDTTAYAYASAVDEDLESIFFGNFLFVVTMAVIAAVTYGATSVLAPSGMRVPMLFVLAVLTGVASLIPVVVGKIVYLPLVVYLGYQAIQLDGSHLVFVGGALVVYFLVLDILPQTFIQPYITGRQLNMLLLMFAYLLGPILFGWYGFFLLPILFVLMLEALRLVLPELLHGEALTSEVSMGDGVGTNPRSAREKVPDGSDTASGSE